jgi:hypothetical protein
LPDSDAGVFEGAARATIKRSQSLAGYREQRSASAKTFDGKEIAVTASDHDGEAANSAPTKGERLGRISLDWWATIVAGIVVLLAVAGLLPKIPW